MYNSVITARNGRMLFFGFEIITLDVSFKNIINVQFLILNFELLLSVVINIWI